MKKIILSILAIIIGGAVIMFFSNTIANHKASEQEKKQALFLKEQDNIALYLVEKYEGIEKIEFTDYSYNISTGYSRFYITINTDYDISVSFGNYGEGDYGMALYRGSGDYLLKKENKAKRTLAGVTVLYLEADDDDY